MIQYFEVGTDFTPTPLQARMFADGVDIYQGQISDGEFIPPHPLRNCLRFQWEYSPDLTSGFTDITGETSDQIVISSSAEVSDSGRYRCRMELGTTYDAFNRETDTGCEIRYSETYTLAIIDCRPMQFTFEEGGNMTSLITEHPPFTSPVVTSTASWITVGTSTTGTIMGNVVCTAVELTASANMGTNARRGRITATFGGSFMCGYTASQGTSMTITERPPADDPKPPGCSIVNSGPVLTGTQLSWMVNAVGENLEYRYQWDYPNVGTFVDVPADITVTNTGDGVDGTPDPNDPSIHIPNLSATTVRLTSPNPGMYTLRVGIRPAGGAVDTTTCESIAEWSALAPVPGSITGALPGLAWSRSLFQPGGFNSRGLPRTTDVGNGDSRWNDEFIYNSASVNPSGDNLMVLGTNADGLRGLSISAVPNRLPRINETIEAEAVNGVRRDVIVTGITGSVTGGFTFSADRLDFFGDPIPLRASQNWANDDELVIPGGVGTEPSHTFTVNDNEVQVSVLIGVIRANKVPDATAITTQFVINGPDIRNAPFSGNTITVTTAGADNGGVDSTTYSSSTIYDTNVLLRFNLGPGTYTSYVRTTNNTVPTTGWSANLIWEEIGGAGVRAPATSFNVIT